MNMTSRKATRRDNGFGCLVSKGEGKPWMARWMYNRKIYCKSTGEVDKKKALKVLEKLTRPYRERRAEDVLVNLELKLKRQRDEMDAAPLLLSDLWKTFCETLWSDDVCSGTAKIYESAVSHLVRWMTKVKKLSKVREVKESDAEDYLKELSASVCAATYNIRLVLFKRVWSRLAGDFGLCNVWEGFKKKKNAAKSSRRALTADELRRVVFAAGGDIDMKVLLALGMYTGLRLGDCCNLKWSDVDFNAKKIVVVPQKTKRHMSSPVEIPMHAALEETLRCAWRAGEVHVSEANAESYASGRIGGKVVELFKKCGIETSKTVDGKRVLVCGFHSLRHTFVSMAVNSGMSPMLVQKIVGHSAVDMTEHYFHENAEKAAEGISMIPDFMHSAARSA